VRGEIGIGVSGRGGGSIGEIPVFERGENEGRDTVVHTLVAINEEFVPPILRASSTVPSTPSPEYVQALEDDPSHDGVPEYWADPEAGVDH
jgi:hypothetical protein